MFPAMGKQASRVTGFSPSCRPIRSCGLQAAQRLPHRRPRPSFDDGYCKSAWSALADVAAYYAGQPQRNPNPVTLANPACCSTCGAWRSAPISRRARHAIGRCRRPDRDAGACRAAGRIHRPATEALCIRRASQRRVWAHAAHRIAADGRRDQGACPLLSGRLPIDLPQTEPGHPARPI